MIGYIVLLGIAVGASLGVALALYLDKRDRRQHKKS
jgi:uncharacterized protein involved in exopolysaccharide biosynthesis